MFEVGSFLVQKHHILHTFRYRNFLLSVATCIPYELSQHSTVIRLKECRKSLTLLDWGLQFSGAKFFGS